MMHQKDSAQLRVELITGSKASGVSLDQWKYETNDGGVSIFGAGGAVLYLNDSDDDPDYQLQNIGGAFAIKDSTNNEERLSITSAGRIGVNITSPETLFHIEQGNALLYII